MTRRNRTQFSDEDVLFMENIGVDGAEAAESDGAAPARSEWTPERMLQVAADGQLTARPVAGSEDLMAVVADGRSATIQEHAAIEDLLRSDHLTVIGRRFALTATGRATLARWSKYRPCVRRSRRQDGGGQ